MNDHPTDFVGSVEEAIKTAVCTVMSDATVRVSGGGGHYTIHVVSQFFEGKSLLQRQRIVLAAIAHLINGDRAPVHAVDSLTTNTPAP